MIDIRTMMEEMETEIRFADDCNGNSAEELYGNGTILMLDNISGDSEHINILNEEGELAGFILSKDVHMFLVALMKAKELGWYVLPSKLEIL